VTVPTYPDLTVQTVAMLCLLSNNAFHFYRAYALLSPEIAMGLDSPSLCHTALYNFNKKQAPCVLGSVVE